MVFKLYVPRVIEFLTEVPQGLYRGKGIKSDVIKAQGLPLLTPLPSQTLLYVSYTVAAYIGHST